MADDPGSALIFESVAKSPLDRVQTRRPVALDLRTRLKAARAQRLALEDGPINETALNAATRWRRHQLHETHAGALASPTAGAAKFLIDDLLALATVDQRLTQLEDAMPWLVRLATDGFLQAMVDTVELHILCHDLDIQLARILKHPEAATEELTRNPYHSTQRAREAELLASLARRLQRISHSATFRTSLRAARITWVPPSAAPLVKVLERGIRAFGKVSSDSFIRQFLERNRHWLDGCAERLRSAPVGAGAHRA